MESKKADVKSNKVSPYAKKEKIDEPLKSEVKGPDDLDIAAKIDNTKPKVIFAKLLSNKNDRLLFKNFNVLSKNELLEFGINKKLSNRDKYFHFLDYMINVGIIDEDKENEVKSEIKEEEKNESKEPKLIIDFSQDKIEIVRNVKKPTHNNTEIDDNQNYGEMLKKINIDIVRDFTIPEKITVKALRQKMEAFYNNLTFKEEQHNNFPDFQSELYFHYQLQNLFESFDELDDKKFVKKIELIQDSNYFIYNVKDKNINDRIILNYFYFAMDVEYGIDKILLSNAAEYKENYKFKNCQIDKKTNELIINSDNKIANFDCYKINDDNIQLIAENKMPLSSILKKSFYSLKGNLLFRELTAKEGNQIYSNFINSNLLKEIFQLLYSIDIDLLNYRDLLTKLFQENTYYFPIKNSTYAAYCDKKCFKIIIDYSVDEINIQKLQLDDKIVIFIKKSFMTVNIHHEFGHGHEAVLFFINPEENEFDSPFTKLKLGNGEEKNTKEGGRLFEYLLYGRVIKKMNLKEIIYINNPNNLKKSLKQYRDDFIGLKNKKLKEVFEAESKNNAEISEIYELYKKLPKDKRKELKEESFKSGKSKAEEGDEEISYDFENLVFSTDKLRKSHNKHKKLREKLDNINKNNTN